MKILQVKKLPIYDVFESLGWYNWSRVKAAANGEVTVISGAPLTQESIDKVQSFINEEKK